MNKAARELKAAVWAYGEAVIARDALPSYQGAALEEPGLTANRKRSAALYDLEKAAVRYVKAERRKKGAAPAWPGGIIMVPTQHWGCALTGPEGCACASAQMAATCEHHRP